MTQGKVLLIGIDAACFEQLDPLLEQGELPTIGALIEEGVARDLDTTFPPWTPSAWPSVVTGVKRLDSEGVKVRVIPSIDCVRASVQAFNTRADLDRFVEGARLAD